MTEVRYAVAPITGVDVRETANGGTAWSMSGYAAVFDQRTTLYDGKFTKVTEDIDPKAFAKILGGAQPLQEPAGVVHFNLGHDMNRVIAATDVSPGEPGSLRLRADRYGLQFLAKVARDDPDGIALAAKMRAGVIKQASFAFTIEDLVTTKTESEDRTEIHERILEIAHLYDVCACAQGAYSQTVSGLRTYAVAIGQLSLETRDERDQPRQATLEARSPVSSDGDPRDGVDSSPPQILDWPPGIDEMARGFRPIAVDRAGGTRNVRNRPGPLL